VQVKNATIPDQAECKTTAARSDKDLAFFLSVSFELGDSAEGIAAELRGFNLPADRESVVLKEAGKLALYGILVNPNLYQDVKPKTVIKNSGLTKKETVEIVEHAHEELCNSANAAIRHAIREVQKESDAKSQLVEQLAKKTGINIDLLRKG